MKGDTSMMVYVLNINGQPLMPTHRCGKVRRLLKEGKAIVVKRCPFTIKLNYEAENITQSVSLGVDVGSKTIGISATTDKKVLYESEAELRTDIVELLSTRREMRRNRRNRLRYRKARFNNRKKKNWIAPSIRHKIDTHTTSIRKVCEILPISNIVIEVAQFDIQKIKNPNIKEEEYQQGEQMNFWNTREYVLARDGHICQCCKGKSKDKILNVHHIESRKVGGDAPNNLITLCETCHTGYHKGTVELPKHIHRGAAFRDAAVMNIMRWKLYDKAKEMFDIPINLTYGYITKNVRIENKLKKSHYIDARCISGNPLAESDGIVYYQKKVRCHNRQIHKANICKGGIRKRNQAEYKVKDFRLFDKVKYNGEEYFIFGRRKSGFFDIRTLDGRKVNNGSISYKKLTLIEKSKNIITERRNDFLPRPIEDGVSVVNIR